MTMFEHIIEIIRGEKNIDELNNTQKTVYCSTLKRIEFEQDEKKRQRELVETVAKVEHFEILHSSPEVIIFKIPNGLDKYAFSFIYCDNNLLNPRWNKSNRFLGDFENAYLTYLGFKYIICEADTFPKFVERMLGK